MATSLFWCQSFYNHLTFYTGINTNGINILDAIALLRRLNQNPIYLGNLEFLVKELNVDNNNILLSGIDVCAQNLLTGKKYCSKTQTDGKSSLFVPYNDNSHGKGYKLTITDPAGNYYQHIKENITIDNVLVSYPIKIVPSSYPIEWHNTICRRVWQNYAHQRWLTKPKFYIDRSPAWGSNIEVTDEMVNQVKEILTSPDDLIKFTDGFTSNASVEVGTTPPWGQNGYVIIWWDDGIGGSGVHAESLIGNQIVYGAVRYITLEPSVMRWVYLAELSQVMGARNDPPNDNDNRWVIVNGVYRYSPQYILLGNFLYNRPEGNKTPDINP